MRHRAAGNGAAVGTAVGTSTTLVERFRLGLLAAGSDGLDMSALRRVAGSNAIPSATIRAALAALEARGEALPGIARTRGRPREVWRSTHHIVRDGSEERGDRASEATPSAGTLPPHLARLCFGDPWDGDAA